VADWQVGDLALCIGNDCRPGLRTGWYPKIGSVYVVAEVVAARHTLRDEIGLNFLEDLDRWAWKFSVFYERYFRKVTPQDEDEFDRETIRLLNGAPVGEPVA
jgi:hypothetical protein